MPQDPKQLAPLKARVSRRDFFGRCSAAAGYAVTGGVALAAELAADDPIDRPIRVAVIGMGHRGLALAETVRDLPGFALAGWYDPSDEAARKAAARFAGGSGQPEPVRFGTETEAFGSPLADAVVIASPSDIHHGQILKAIEARKHVLTEKPAGFGPGELDRIEQSLASDFDRVFLIGYQRRHNPHRARLCAWLAEGNLGPIIDIRADWAQPLGAPRGRDGWMTDPARTGDWVAEHGDHIWDILAELRPGFDVPRVLHASRVPGGGSDSAWFKASMAWPDGVTADVRHSFLPGGQFASPGLNVTVQCRSGIADLISGRIGGGRKALPQQTFDKPVNEDSALLQAFAGRIRSCERAGEAPLLANLDEIRRTKYVDRLRNSVIAAFGA